MATSSELESQLRDHWPRLRRFAFSLSRDAADADDLVQDVAIKAMGAASQWQVGTRFDSWLFRIARNQWIDTLRSSQRRNRGRAPAEEAEVVGVDPRAQIEAGLDLTRHRARLLDRDLVAAADLILTMSRGHLSRVERLGGEGKAHLLGAYANASAEESELRDPYGGDVEGYRQTLQQLERLLIPARERLLAESAR